MKLRRFLFVVILLIVGCVVSSAQEVKKIAILETVDVVGDVTPGTKLTIRTLMAKAITEIDGYEALARVNLGQIMGEHNFQRTGNVSDDQIREIGAMTGAAYILICEVAYIDKVNVTLTTQMIDIETTKYIGVAIEQSATDAKSIMNACVSLARQLLLGGSSSKSNIGNSTYAQQSSTTPNQQSQVREIEVNGVKFKMIYVAGGTFTMGATAEQVEYNNDETPAHQVTLSDYFIGETEVTHELWVAVMDSDPYEGIKGYNVADAKWFSNFPALNISWEECREFIQKLNQLTGLRFRLPTEAEWEYAARGGNKSKGYKYSGSNRIDDVAWYDGNSGSAMHEVATYYPNELGLYDMSGNVWEWCSDWYGSYSSMAQTDPSGAGSGSYRVLRGGSWANDARFCCVAIRYGNTPDNRSTDYGFRLVCSRL